MICFTLCSTDMNPPHDDYQIKISTNSLILAMVAASRNCAAETPPMRAGLMRQICSAFSADEQTRKPLFLVKPIVAQSVLFARIQRRGRVVGLPEARGRGTLNGCQWPQDLPRCI